MSEWCRMCEQQVDVACADPECPVADTMEHMGDYVELAEEDMPEPLDFHGLEITDWNNADLVNDEEGC